MLYMRFVVRSRSASMHRLCWRLSAYWRHRRRAWHQRRRRRRHGASSARHPAKRRHRIVARHQRVARAGCSGEASAAASSAAAAHGGALALSGCWRLSGGAMARMPRLLADQRRCAHQRRRGSSQWRRTDRILRRNMAALAPSAAATRCKHGMAASAWLASARMAAAACGRIGIYPAAPALGGHAVK